MEVEEEEPRCKNPGCDGWRFADCPLCNANDTRCVQCSLCQRCDRTVSLKRKSDTCINCGKPYFPGLCWLCDNYTRCDNCDHCPVCKNGLHPFVPELGLDNFFTTADDALDKLENLQDEWNQDSGNKRRRMAPEDDLPAPATVARTSAFTDDGADAFPGNTFKPTAIDLGIATWNINHFNRPEQKKACMRWLFETHTWLDVLVLQEINAGARGEITEYIDQINRDYKLGLTLVFGPQMQSLACVGEVDVEDEAGGDEEVRNTDDEDEPDEDDVDQNIEEEEDAPTFSSLTIQGEVIRRQTIRGKKSFQIEVDRKWFAVRPGQREYYGIIFRNCDLKRAYGLYKDKEEVGYNYPDDEMSKTAVPLYWSKTGNIPLNIEEGKRKGDRGWKEDLESGKLPEDVFKYLDTFGFKPAAKVEEAEESKAVKTRKWFRRWKVVHDLPDDLYVYELPARETGKGSKKINARNKKRDIREIKVLWKHNLLPATRRPLIVYELQPRGASNTVSVAVVHTSPEGTQLRRLDEFQQVQGAFQFSKTRGGFWIFAGDYYLDPESQVIDRRGAGSQPRRLSLFEKAAETEGLQISISLSATNQSAARNTGRRNIAPDTTGQGSKVILPGFNDGKNHLAVNKRADFFLCNPEFQFHRTGLVCPRGGLLNVDPNHNALNWWSLISDHCPVGGVFSQLDTSIKFNRDIDPQRTNADGYWGRVIKALEELGELHAAALQQLDTFFTTIDQRCFAYRFPPHPISLPKWMCGFDYYRFEYLLCLHAAGVWREISLQPRLFQSPWLTAVHQDLAPTELHLFHQALGDAANYQSSLASKKRMEEFEETKNKTPQAEHTPIMKMVPGKSKITPMETPSSDIVSQLIQEAATVYRAIAVLGYSIHDFDLTPENDNYGLTREEEESTQTTTTTTTGTQ